MRSSQSRSAVFYFLYSQGKMFTSIQPQTNINDVCMYPNSGKFNWRQDRVSLVRKCYTSPGFNFTYCSCKRNFKMKNFREKFFLCWSYFRPPDGATDTPLNCTVHKLAVSCRACMWMNETALTSQHESDGTILLPTPHLWDELSFQLMSNAFMLPVIRLFRL